MIGKLLGRGGKQLAKTASGTLARPSAMDTVLTKGDSKIVYGMLGSLVAVALWTVPCMYNYAKRYQRFVA